MQRERIETLVRELSKRGVEILILERNIDLITVETSHYQNRSKY